MSYYYLYNDSSCTTAAAVKTLVNTAMTNAGWVLTYPASFSSSDNDFFYRSNGEDGNKATQIMELLYTTTTLTPKAWYGFSNYHSGTLIAYNTSNFRVFVDETLTQNMYDGNTLNGTSGNLIGTSIVISDTAHTETTINFNPTTNVITWTAAHGLVADAPISFTTTGALPSGMTAGTVYYVVNVSSTTAHQISTTRGGSALDFGTGASGTNKAVLNYYTLASNIGASSYTDNTFDIIKGRGGYSGGSLSTLTISNVATNYLSIYGDKDMFSIFNTTGATKTHILYGHIPTLVWSNTLGVLQGELSSPSHLTVTLDNVDGFLVGKTYQVIGYQDNSSYSLGVGRETVTLTGVDTLNKTITVSSVTGTYPANSLVGILPSVFGAGRFLASGLNYYHMTNPLNATGLNDIADYADVIWTKTSIFGSTGVNVDTRTNTYVLQPIVGYLDHDGATSTNDSIGCFLDKNFLYCANISFATGDTLEMHNLYSGTGGAGGDATKIVDASLPADLSIYVGKSIIFISGATITGDIRKVATVDNGTKTLYLDKNASATTNGASYHICDEAYRYFKNGEFTLYANPLAIREGY